MPQDALDDIRLAKGAWTVTTAARGAAGGWPRAAGVWW